MPDTTHRFAHLNVHTDYSLDDSILRFDSAITKTVEDGLSGIGISDINNLFAAIRFYKKASSSGVKPIISTKMYIQDDLFGSDSAAYPMVVIARNNTGYRHLCQLNSQIYEEGQVGDHPHVKMSWLEERKDGLILLSGGREGNLGHMILDGNLHGAKAFATRMKSTFGQNGFFMEVQRIGHPDDNRYNKMALELGSRLQVPVVATNNVRFLKKSDFESHQIRVAIHKGLPLDLYERQNPHAYTQEQYLKSPEEMEALFDDIPEVLENTARIADACQVDIELGNNYLPAFPTVNDEPESEYLKRMSHQGLIERIKKNFGEHEVNEEKYENYFQRLDFELNVINTMGFPGYFLIVSDFIQWAKDNDIAVGPGRGSGAGSLVAYALKITDLDPLKYDLLFERFLNPERVSMPDFDVDFCMDNRDRVIQYVAEKYGHKSVSQIITFGKMAAKTSIRDVARALGYSFSLGMRMSNMVPDRPDVKLSEAIAESSELDHMMNNDPDVAHIMKHALALEGVTRQTGKHAGGVVIAPGPLTDYTPTYSEPDGSGFVSQYDKNDVEDAGLVKFDFLGLRTLTISDNAIKLINSRNNINFDLESIPLNDKAVLDLCARGDTTAVFQIESRGMKELLRKLKPDCFEDLIALVALYRPGPLQSGMVDNFINRKHGREEISYPDPTYQHELLKPILEPTYGIILYQEQVMQIAQALAGYTLGQADMLRRAMGKKKPEEMEKQRAIFAQGAKDKGIDENLSLKIFELVEKFAGYGFNKSHSAAYALISYQTAYLKLYYPAEFMSAVMSSVMNDTEKVVPFFKEAEKMGLQVKMPSINNSKIEFHPSGDAIYYGLGAVKGIGASYLDKMLEERERGGLFASPYDWIYRTNPSKTVIEAAIRSGTLDEFEMTRSTLFDAYPAWKAEAKKEREQSSKQIGLFTSSGSGSVKVQTLPEWPVNALLAGERKTLGLFMSGHPLDDYKEMVDKLTTTTLHDVMLHSTIDETNDIVPDRPVTVAGYIDNLNIKDGKKGSRAQFMLDDGTSQINTMVFPESFHKSQHVIRDDAVVVIKGKVTRNKSTKMDKLIAYSVQSIDMLKDKEISKVVFTHTDLKQARQSFKKIKECVDDCADGFSELYFKNPDSGDLVKIGSRSIRISDDLMNNLRGVFGSENVTTFFRSVSEDQKDMQVKKQEGDRTRAERQHKISSLFLEAEMSMS